LAVAAASKGVFTLIPLVTARIGIVLIVTAAMVNLTAVLAPVIAAWSVRVIEVADANATFAVIPVVAVTAPAVIAPK